MLFWTWFPFNTFRHNSLSRQCSGRPQVATGDRTAFVRAKFQNAPNYTKLGTWTPFWRWIWLSIIAKNHFYDLKTDFLVCLENLGKCMGLVGPFEPCYGVTEGGNHLSTWWFIADPNLTSRWLSNWKLDGGRGEEATLLSHWDIRALTPLTNHVWLINSIAAKNVRPSWWKHLIPQIPSGHWWIRNDSWEDRTSDE